MQWYIINMKAKVSTWGNSLGIRIPKSISELLGLANGAEVKFEVEGNKIIITTKRDLAKESEELIKGIDLDELCNRMSSETIHGLDEHDDYAPVGKEIW